MRLFLILVAVPIIEIALFIEIGGLIGTWPTIAVVVATAFAGSVLLRQQGLAAMRDVQARLAAGEAPGRLLADGAMILFAGALLLTPGFFTDAVGFALLFPPMRTLVWRWAASRVQVTGTTRRSASWHFRASARGRAAGTTVDGTFTEAEMPKEADNDPSAPSIDPPERRD